MAENTKFEFVIDNTILRAYLFYSSVLIVKIFLLAALTTSTRIKKKAFINSEDAAAANVSPKIDESVERVRRAHLNDLENIPPFLIIAFIYILTQPGKGWFVFLIRTYTAARFVHSVVYAVVPLPQPARAVSFLIGFFITLFMAFQCIIYFC